MKGSAGGFTAGAVGCDVGKKCMPCWSEFMKDGGAAGLLGAPAAGYAADTGAGAGAEAAGVFWWLLAFCRAIFARVSMMLAGTAGGAGVGRLLSEGSVLGGGLPGGVVDWSTTERQVRHDVARSRIHEASHGGSYEGRDRRAAGPDMTGGDLLFSLSLKPSIIFPGKVCPFSQMSTSFLIFSYAPKQPSKSLFTRRER